MKSMPALPSLWRSGPYQSAGSVVPADVLLAVGGDLAGEGVGGFVGRREERAVVPGHGIDEQVLAGVAGVGHHAIDPFPPRESALGGAGTTGILVLEAHPSAL